MAEVVGKNDIEKIRSRYEQRYLDFGYSPRTLDWDKGKQDLRFSVLTSQVDLRGKHILDIGCGFGDLNRKLSALTNGDYSYLGVDLAPSLIDEASKRYGNERVRFICGDIQTLELDEFDYAIASGTFNIKFENGDNMLFIKNIILRVFERVRIGFAFDFLSDKVDFIKENTWHSSPEKILSLGYGVSRNVMLLNQYMPFEFSMFVFKNNDFDPSTTIFNRWADLYVDQT